MAMTEDNETLLVAVINALYRERFDGVHLDKWLETPATEQISSEGLKAAINIVDFLVPLTSLCDSMMNLSVDIGHNLNPDDFAVLVAYIFNTGLPLPDEWKQDLINATVGLVPQETEEGDNLYSHWLCKVCKVAPAECWTHAPIDECTDTVCIEEKHGAMCMSCQNDMLRFHSEINLRNN